MAKVIFIGTGSGKTSLKRFHSSFLILTKDFNLLVDAGDGISKALLTQNIDFNTIDGVLFSHLHPDHYTGLAALIVQMKMYGRKNKLKIFIHKSLIKTIENLLLNSYLFPGRLGFEIVYSGFEDDEKFNVADSLNFLPKQNSHLSEVSKAGQHTGQSFSCSSFLFKVDEKTIQYTGDAGSIKDLLLFENFDVNFLITETTHIDIKKLLETAGKKIFPELIFLTHLTDDELPSLEKQIASLPGETSKKYIVADDGMIINI